ncbi:hypothetical protein ACFV8T_42975 [Streptomyces sp. NPDC059832]|uniref:hypothetical protein n=1 Tax=unclassified Streptomyces TaxID=2593676 RepID=UPI003650B188
MGNRVIDGFYNPRRIQKQLGCLSPIEFEEKHYADQAASEQVNLKPRQPALTSQSATPALRGNLRAGLSGIEDVADLLRGLAPELEARPNTHACHHRCGLFFLAGGLALLSQMWLLPEAARAHPLQAWPSQMERVPSGGRAVLLLAPDGSVARELKSDVPDEVWFEMIDGRGMLWIAGDLRFNCLVAAPGGRTVWRGKGTPYGSLRQSGSGLRPLDEEFVRVVTQQAFDSWQF